MKTTVLTRSWRFVLSMFLVGCLSVSEAATLVIQSRDAPGVGFNDPTPAAPVAGNSGRTLGEQRMNVYRHVAAIWGQALTSDVKITVSAGWEPLECNATGAVLGSAMPYNVWHDFPDAPRSGTWYPQALANKLSKRNLTEYFGQPDDGTGYGNVDIKTQFNSRLGLANCLEGAFFYLGLDGKAGNQINFATTLLHELGHGLGFSLLTTNAETGERMSGIPSIWESFMYDDTVGKSWLAMSEFERYESSVNTNHLSWAGPHVLAAVPQVLAFKTLQNLIIGGSGAGAAAGMKKVGPADFGPPLTSDSFSRPIVRIVDQINGSGLACAPLSGSNAALVAGRVALIDRGGCTFVAKVKNLQNAGANSVLVADNVVADISGLAGSDDSVSIPSARILKVDGDVIKAVLLNRIRGQGAPVITAKMSVLVTGEYSGTDSSGRPLLYAPGDFSAGSSVSHWDTSLTPNMLMEPFISSDLSTIVTAPRDMTLPLLKDLGW